MRQVQKAKERAKQRSTALGTGNHRNRRITTSGLNLCQSGEVGRKQSRTDKRGGEVFEGNSEQSGVEDSE